VILLFTMPAFVGFSDTVFGEMFNGLQKMFATFLVTP